MLAFIKEKWQDILSNLKNEYDISDVSFNTWLKPLEVAAVEEDTILIVVPEESIGLQYIKKKYSTPLKVSVAEITGTNFNIEFILPDQYQNMYKPAVQEFQQQNVFEKAGLNPKYTFSNFIVGDNNNLAHAASLAVAESPAEIYNPLYIYGGVGLGKTHLMQAIAHFILSHDPDKKVLYVTSENFTNEIIDAIRNESPHSNIRFREKYRNVDVLLIDDIQFISGKESTQEEFFHTFNELYEHKKQIIISSDKPPKDIKGLEERLISRFLWGLPIDLQSPNYETRVAILKKKIELENCPAIPDDVIFYIAANVSSNIRELEGSLTKIIAYSRLTSSEINLEFAEGVLKDLFTNNQREITPENIIKIVSEHFGLTVADLSSKKKSSDVVYPRQLAMYLCRTLTDAALSLIGKKLGNRDHTTVLHGYEKIQNDMDINEKIRNDVDILKKKICPY
ncbi:MAG: chromosomal replication initiator protein DnaA [Parasporobacterium sp.]|nr:chromosomal replication initiator protein DnaA [Parasporobacterium sp.]